MDEDIYEKSNKFDCVLKCLSVRTVYTDPVCFYVIYTSMSGGSLLCELRIFGSVITFVGFV